MSISKVIVTIDDAGTSTQTSIATAVQTQVGVAPTAFGRAILVIYNHTGTTYSTSTGSPAFSSGAFPDGSTIVFNNSGGLITGKGGAGGASGAINCSAPGSSVGGAGNPGGHAIEASGNILMNIYNTGTIGGGGGGGGGGGSAMESTGSFHTSQGGGGGGGAGYSGGAGGPMGVNTVCASPGLGIIGGPGSTASGGGGGAGGKCGLCGDLGGAGGSGGGYAVTGSIGTGGAAKTTSTYAASGGAGGGGGLGASGGTGGAGHGDFSGTDAGGSGAAPGSASRALSGATIVWKTVGTRYGAAV